MGERSNRESSIEKASASKHQLKVNDQDYIKIKAFISEYDIGTNSDFLHMVAENLDLLRPAFESDDGDPDNAVSAPVAVSTDDDDASGFPSLLPTASWSLEDRKRFLDIITRDRDEYGYTAPLYIKRAFDEQKLIPYDYNGDPKIKTKFGYYTHRFLDEHPYLIAPDWFCWQAEKEQLHPVIFPEMDDPETDKKVLLEFFKDPVIGTLLFRKAQIEDEKRRKEKQDGEFPPERDGIRIIQK